MFTYRIKQLSDGHWHVYVLRDGKRYAYVGSYDTYTRAKEEAEDYLKSEGLDNLTGLCYDDDRVG